MFKNQNDTTRARGFTLIELLVVIGLIAIFASIVGFNMMEPRAKALDAQRMSDLKQIQVALERYHAKNKEYPDSLDELSDFMSSIPTDPGSENTYEYQSENDGDDYAIQATSNDGEKTCEIKSADAAGFGSDSPCPFQ